MPELQNAPTQYLEEAAARACRALRAPSRPYYATAAHICFAGELAGEDPYFARIAAEGRYVNFTLPEAFFLMCLEACESLPPLQVRDDWTEERLFSPAVYAALTLRGAAPQRLSAQQQMALVRLWSLPLIKGGRGKLDAAAREAALAFAGAGSAVSKSIVQIAAALQKEYNL